VHEVYSTLVEQKWRQWK